ncbi:MAG: hypothetical protein LBU35_01170 [Holosporales bacterium]|jgi:trk system potassium uptake protein TrkH|nr:hypothetical protein [Holosporales bacterium]
MRINLQVVAFANGIALCGLALAMCIPLLYDIILLRRNLIEVFLPSAIICLFLGVSTILSFKSSNTEISSLTRQDAFLIVSSLWIIISIFSSFPFYFYDGIKLSFISSFFEATSGITTTGASIYQNVEILPRTLNLWRFVLHFIGGIGIVAIGIVAFPLMKIGGMQLFLAENSDKSQKLFPRVSQIAGFFVGTYIAIIGFFTILLKSSGMGLFDSICHSISAISTGGFSTRNLGIQYYNSSLIEFIILCAMFMGGITFLEIIKGLKTRGKGSLQNQQIRGYFKLTSMVVLISLLFLFIRYNTNISMRIITDSAFNIISAITTTGLVLQNETLSFFKEPCVKICIFVLAMIGGCSGSTTGGIKIFRIQILYSLFKNYINKLSNPFNAEMPKYQTKKIEETLITSIISFLFLLFLSFTFSTILITITSNVSASLAVSAVISCLFNLGYNIDYEVISPVSKIILSIDMIIGRLEIIPIVAIFSKSFWKK